MVTEGADQARKDNIPATVDRIIELLDHAHETVSRMKPEPTEEGKAPDEHGLHPACIRARDKAQHLNKRFSEIADTVGAL